MQSIPNVTSQANVAQQTNDTSANHTTARKLGDDEPGPEQLNRVVNSHSECGWRAYVAGSCMVAILACIICGMMAGPTLLGAGFMILAIISLAGLVAVVDQ